MDDLLRLLPPHCFSMAGGDIDKSANSLHDPRISTRNNLDPMIFAPSGGTSLSALKLAYRARDFRGDAGVVFK